MFKGLSAFPLTPYKQEDIDIDAFEKLIANLVNANVDSICPMGSTGLYPYLTSAEKATLTSKCVAMSGDIPVMAGIGALRTKEVLKNAEAVQKAGASAVLLAPVSYHRLHSDEVYSLFDSVSKNVSIPICVYENPGTTNFTFSDDLYKKVCHLPNVCAIKIPGMPFENVQGKERLATLRALLPQHISIGVSGDKFGVAGIAAGCDLWLSVLGGLFPRTVQHMISRAKLSPQESDEYSSNLNDLWAFFIKYKGGLRVMASAAAILGYTESECLPAPLQAMNREDQKILEGLIHRFDLT